VEKELLLLGGGFGTAEGGLESFTGECLDAGVAVRLVTCKRTIFGVAFGARIFGVLAFASG
jgi:hypothetical protein